MPQKSHKPTEAQLEEGLQKPLLFLHALQTPDTDAETEKVPRELFACGLSEGRIKRQLRIFRYYAKNMELSERMRYISKCKNRLHGAALVS